MNIGVVIQDLRKSKGLTQAELAAKCKITQTSLSQIETGAKKPSPTTMKLICKSLGVPEPYLHLMAIEESDVPKERKEMYKQFFPTIKTMMENILLDKKK